MTLEFAIRATEILLSLAFIQQSIEHLNARGIERLLFAVRIVLCLLLLTGFQTPWICLALVLLTLLLLHRFQGPYNGGSDRMGILILCCLCLTNFLPITAFKELAFGYLALQLILSYFISGWVKIINPDWRNGRALNDVFRFSAYPASESMRNWANYPRILFAMSWAAILFEIVFPVTLFHRITLYIALFIAAGFHFSNACFFGLNRFFWIWLAAYPSLIWLQGRIFQ